MIKVNGPLFRLFTAPFGVDPGYFNSHPGRPGFYMRQLMRRHGLGQRPSVLLSAAFNQWLDLVERSTLSERLKVRLFNCTRIYSNAKVIRHYRCQLRICPWCQALKILQAVYWSKRLPVHRAVVQEQLLDRPQFRQPHVRTGRILLSVRNVHLEPCTVQLKLSCMAAYFIHQPERQDLASVNLAQDSIYEILAPRLITLLHPEIGLYLAVSNNVRSFFLSRVVPSAADAMARLQ